MKKFTSLLLALLFALPALAQQFKYKELWYHVLDEEAKTCEVGVNSGVEGDLIIPSTVSNEGNVYTVISIGDYAFSTDDITSLTSVTIPEGIISIGYSAFYKCSLLASVMIPNSVTSIGECAFMGCSSLTSVTIPESVISIGNHAFCDCTSLTSVAISKGVTTIGNATFFNCGALTSVVIPEGVTTIGDDIFGKCSSLASVTIPEGINSIGDRAFYDCSSLASVTIPESVATIGYRAFYDCTSLTLVVIPEGVTTIGAYAFYGCISLTSVYYYAENLIWGPTSIFSDSIYKNTPLYLRESSLEQAQSMSPWYLFTNRGVFDSKIDGITANTDIPVEVYTLNGVKVADSTNGLPIGVYVVRQGNEVRKLSVK